MGTEMAMGPKAIFGDFDPAQQRGGLQPGRFNILQNRWLDLARERGYPELAVRGMVDLTRLIPRARRRGKASGGWSP